MTLCTDEAVGLVPDVEGNDSILCPRCGVMFSCVTEAAGLWRTADECMSHVTGTRGSRSELVCVVKRLHGNINAAVVSTDQSEQLLRAGF